MQIPIVVRRHAAAVLDLVWPPVCPACGRRAEQPREHFCERCWGRLVPAGEGREEGVPGTPSMRAAWRVDALFLDMLATSKYRRRRDVGRRLARESAARFGRCVPSGVLVPVPLAPAKRRERGFNQPEDFAIELARATGRPVRPDWLRRRGGGRSLAGTGREQRADAVRGAFSPGPAFPGREAPSILLVDDVVTTGSTAAECILALRETGGRVAAVLAMGRARSTSDDAPPTSRESLGGW